MKKKPAALKYYYIGDSKRDLEGTLRQLIDYIRYLEERIFKLERGE